MSAHARIAPSFPRRCRGALALAAGAACAVSAAPAAALQPLSQFLVHASTWNPDNRAAHAVSAQRDAEVDVTTSSLEPNLQMSLVYTRNQFEVSTGSLFSGGSGGGAMTMAQGSVPNLVIQPQNQVDASFVLTIPILNIASWDRRSAAKATRDGAKADEIGAGQTVARSVARAYYLVTGYEAMRDAAARNLDLTKHNVALARDKKGGGTASELDVQRALAEEAKAEQSVTAADLDVKNALRDLASLSGLEPDEAVAVVPDDLHDEPPFAEWIAGTDRLPAVQSAVASRRSAEEASRAVHVGWLPTVSGIAEEKLTNATAFAGGHAAFYLLQLAANWRLDAGALPQVRAQDAVAAAARANEDKVRRAAEDAVYRDWQQVRADIDASRSARAQVESTHLAATLAEDRYASGVATQLDVLQARQEAFAADVARVQADADLAYARTALRLDAGRPLTAAGNR